MALAIDLTGKVILICGVARGGIGGATARQVARAGGTIVALDKDQALIDPTVEDVEALGGTIHALVADVTDPAHCEGVIARVIEKAGRIDAVANVAGGTTDEEWVPLDETPTAWFRRTLALNLDYVFMLCRDVARHWIDAGRGGAIVNVGSVSAIASAPWHGPYGAGKAGIAALTRTMAQEWHEFGIRANTVQPGAVMSERVAAKRAAANVLGGEENFTTPEELGNTIAFLLSDLAGGLSGQTISVDRSLSTKFCGGARRSRRELAGEKA